jgi:2-haloacid dehalogenase
MNSNNTKPVIIFDVNETLLDMAPLKNNINSLLEEPQAFRIWFGMVLHYSLVENCTINTMTSVKSQQLSLNDC